ncbi:hypothetical protein M5K25_001699 [Dendrobium thyrsiflorum]|uniref:Uncharacterized protein n=1 Tax=Dendrobium thyrsiflorum TaxID=117978 RepID=A0ABD0VR83_DENTH
MVPQARNMLYVATTSGVVSGVSLEVTPFGFLWRYEADAPLFGSLCLDSSSGNVFCCSVNGSVMALNPKGHSVWKVAPEAVEELPILAFSPLLKGSSFYPLTAAAGEERVSWIASTPPCPVDYSIKKTPKEKQVLRTRILRNIIHTCAAQAGETKEQHMKHLKGVISHKFENEVLKEEKYEARNLTPQPVRKNKKYVKQTCDFNGSGCMSLGASPPICQDRGDSLDRVQKWSPSRG